MIRISDLVSVTAREIGSRTSPSPPSAHANLIRFDSNENPFGPSPRALAAMQEALGSSNLYPDDDCNQLREKLSSIHRVKPEQVLVTPGSTGMLSLLCQTLLSPGRNAVTSEGSFIVYGMLVRAAGARLIEVPMAGDAFDLSAILKAINAETRLVFLANPNNPTGTMIDASTLDRFLAAVPDHVVVVLDEAYHEFAPPFAQSRKLEYPQSVDCLRRKDNVIILQTFSKVHGLAGLRIGYGLGSPALLSYCARMANTYSVSSISQAAALAALEDHDHIERTVSNNTGQAKLLSAELEKMGFRVVPTFANFVCCDVGRDAGKLAESLLEKKVSVRPLAAWGADRCVRITIGTPEQNQTLLGVLRTVKN